MSEVTIETANGSFIVKKPAGRIGAIHFSIMQSCAPSGAKDADGNVILSPADQEALREAFLKWSQSVLKNILDEKKSGVKYDDMKGEDQFAIFMAMMDDIKIGDEFFRIVE